MFILQFQNVETQEINENLKSRHLVVGLWRIFLFCVFFLCILYLYFAICKGCAGVLYIFPSFSRENKLNNKKQKLKKPNLCLSSSLSEETWPLKSSGSASTSCFHIPYLICQQICLAPSSKHIQKIYPMFLLWQRNDHPLPRGL